MVLQYHSIEPEANRSVHKENNSVSFNINTDRNLKAQSVRLEGEIRFTSDGAARHTVAQRAFMNKRVGAHSVISSIQVEVDGQIIEAINSDYSRLVHMVQSATKSNDDYYSGKELCELKAPSDDVAIQYVAGQQVPASGADGVSIDMDFSIMPYICLNRSSNDLQLSRLNNNVKITLNLERNVNVLQGRGQLSTSTYEIRNLRMTYRTEDPTPVPSVSMDSVVSFKSVVNSSFHNTSAKVPAVVHSVSGSFLPATQENQVKTDNLQLSTPPELEEVQILFNNSTSSLQRYVLEDYGQFLEGYLSSLKNSGNASVSANNVAGNSTFGIGLSFGDNVLMENETLNVQLKSGANSGNEYNLYLYFHSKITV